MPPFDAVLDAPQVGAREERRARWGLPAITLRRLHAGDAAALGLFYDGLSQASRSARFHSGVPALPQAWLARLARADDPAAFVLLAIAGAGAASVIVGEARYACEPGIGAEFAMVIADPFQGRGLGRWMLERLVKVARAARITTLYGDVQRDNEPMLALARAAGFRPRRSDDPHLVTVARNVF